MSIFITGDTHGSLESLSHRIQTNKIGEGDTLIVCGDFGFVWNGEWKKNLRKIEKMTKAKILVVLGNHENYDIINSFSFVYQFGGKCRSASKNVYFAERGHIYNIEGKNFFCFGGALSIDRWNRTPKISWWEDELPTSYELLYGQEVMYDNLNEIDYVITHDGPNIARKQIYGNFLAEEWDYRLPQTFDSWLRILYFNSSTFKRWYFGHMHPAETKEIDGVKCTCLYYDVVKLGDCDNFN